MSVGRKYLDELHARQVAEREAEHVTARCAWCDWTHADTLKAARDAHAAHRTAIHPERVVKRRKTRHRPSPILVAGKTLDDNIAEARRQGANGSDHPEPAPEPAPERVPEPAAAAITAVEEPNPAPAAPVAAVCVVDGCRMTPVARRGRYAGLCHEHRNQALRDQRHRKQAA